MTPNPTNDDFLSVLQQHRKIIFKVCNAYCKEPKNRKDLAQEITIQLWKSFPKYDPQYKFSTWMYRIALNVAISFYRKDSKNRNTASIPEEGFHIADDHDAGQDLEANITLLYGFIAQLDELHKALMILYLDNISYRDIAEVLGITETNVATKISRIKQKFKQQFENINNPSL